MQPGQGDQLDMVAYSDEGDRLPDFSFAGYASGTAPLPDVPVVETLDPAPGDNRARIQEALDRLAQHPANAAGWHGALLLRRGRYEIGDSLHLRTSGIVLRGEGDGPDGTVLVATKLEKHDLLLAGGQGDWQGLASEATGIAEAYVPVGARSFRVEQPGRLHVGDTVIVRRASNAAWIEAIGMNHIPPRPDGGPVEQWKPNTMDLLFDRTVAAIDGDRITVDAPLTDGFRQTFGGGRVYRYTFPARLRQIGIERLRLESGYNHDLRGNLEEGEAKLTNVFTDEAHGWNAITFNAVTDAWAREVTSVAFGNACVFADRTAKRITVLHCSCLDPVSQLGGSRRYAFPIAGQLVLVRDCYARRSRHAFVLESRVPGPNVFLDCRAEEGYSTSEPHQRWASGTLWDNVTVDGPNAWLSVMNRSWMGTGHGWAGAQMVFWNCRAPLIVVQHPPGAQNFAIGTSGKISRPGLVVAAAKESAAASRLPLPATLPFWGDGYRESPDQPVSPRSLYLAQLHARGIAP